MIEPRPAGHDAARIRPATRDMVGVARALGSCHGRRQLVIEWRARCRCTVPARRLGLKGRREYRTETRSVEGGREWAANGSFPAHGAKRGLSGIGPYPALPLCAPFRPLKPPSLVPNTGHRLGPTITRITVTAFPKMVPQPWLALTKRAPRHFCEFGQPLSGRVVGPSRHRGESLYVPLGAAPKRRCC